MKNKSLAFLLSCVAATAIIGGIISKVVAENINTFTPSSTNYVNFLSAPAKRLKASIGPADMSFQLSDVNGWDGTPLTSSSFGGDAYVVFHNDAGTAYEIMQIDPTTIGSSSITILNRGMSFNGDLMATSSALALTWIKNTTIVELGTDVPQLLQHSVQIGGNQTIAGIKIFSSIPGSNGTPVNPTDLVTKFYADSLAIGLSPQANTTTGGTIMFATAAQTAAGTATGTYSGHTFYLAPLNSSFSLVASTSPVGVVASGTIDSTFLLNGNYSLGSTTVQSLTSASTTLNGTTTVNGATTFNSSVIGAQNYFGNGFDGSSTISATTTLTRDMYYTNLTVNAQLNTGGYKIFVNGTLTGNTSGIIKSPTPSAASGQTGAVSSTVGDFSNLPGGSGGANSNCNNGSGSPSSGGASPNASHSLSTTGGAGAAGASETNGGASGSVTTSTNFLAGLNYNQYSSVGTFNLFDVAAQNYIADNMGTGGGGGGGGASSSGGSTLAVGGGGGASGFPIFIVARIWAGTFSIIGLGGNGAAYTPQAGCNAAGGGGGGSGSPLIAIYQNKTYSGTITLMGGSPGGTAATGTTGNQWLIPITSLSNP